MKFSNEVQRKIEKYSPDGGLDQTARVFLVLCGVNHKQVREHIERVALLAERVTKRLKKDSKAAFFAGLLHDVGKLLLAYSLFDGHNINKKEYAEVKKHAMIGFEALMELQHQFTALCAGFHHAMYTQGYGLDSNDFPDNWGPATMKKVLEVSTIISICDFIDAFTHRETYIKDGSDKNTPDLKGMLEGKYPDDHRIISVALEESKKMLEREVAA